MKIFFIFLPILVWANGSMTLDNVDINTFVNYSYQEFERSHPGRNTYTCGLMGSSIELFDILYRRCSFNEFSAMLAQATSEEINERLAVRLVSNTNRISDYLHSADFIPESYPKLMRALDFVDSELLSETNDHGRYSLHFLALSMLENSLSFNQAMALYERMIDLHDLEINTVDHYDRTPLYYAILNNSPILAHFLLARGANFTEDEYHYYLGMVESESLKFTLRTLYLARQAEVPARSNRVGEELP